ncbi:MAG: hypothetical protein ACRD4X_10880 [Candidatus Acidiferrales bacterium]
MLLSPAIHAHGAENVVRGEVLAVDVEHQNFDVLAAALERFQHV